LDPEPPEDISEQGDSFDQGAQSLPLHENPLAVVPDLALIDAEFPNPIDPIRLNRPLLKQLIVQYLPPREEAVELVNLYYEMVAWE
jgi:hypothetical protein